MQRALALCLLLAAPATAQEYMDADAFEEAVTGNSVYYNDGTGQYAGVEAYHPRNRVTWVAPGGICEKGTWYQEGSQICFLYDGNPFPACWGFFREDGRLMAEPTPGGVPWEAFRVTTDPIPCESPFVGS